MLRLAGFSSGTGVCARGGCPARPCVSLAASRARHRPALRFSCSVLPSASSSLAFLSRRFAFGIARPCVPVAALCVRHRPALRSCRGVLRSITPAVCRLAPNRTACGILRSCSAGSRSPIVRSRDVGAVICLCGFTSGLAVSLWRSRRGCQRTRGTENGERSWRRGLCASLRGHIGLEILSAGSTLGAARPQTCAKESSTLWTLFI